MYDIWHPRIGILASTGPTLLMSHSLFENFLGNFMALFDSNTLNVVLLDLLSKIQWFVILSESYNIETCQNSRSLLSNIIILYIVLFVWQASKSFTCNNQRMLKRGKWVRYPETDRNWALASQLTSSAFCSSLQSGFIPGKKKKSQNQCSWI